MRHRYSPLELELAIRLNLPPATLDGRLATAARANGIAVLPDAL